MVHSDLDSGEFHDLVIRCGGKEWKAHRVIVSAASTFFHKACQDTFKVSDPSILSMEERLHAFPLSQIYPARLLTSYRRALNA